MVFPKSFRFLGLFIGAFFLLPTQGNSEEKTRFGIWVEAEGTNQPFASLKNFNEYLDYIGNWSFTDLYCQVYRGGRSWFPSMLADDTPYREAVSQGFDPLGETIRQAKPRGQRVHAWLNILRLFQNPNAPLLKVFGEERVLQYDNFGNSVKAYDESGNPPQGQRGYSLGTYGLWVDPSDPEVRRYIVETIRDVVLQYPELSGIHLDMIRYPDAMRRTGSDKLPFRPEFGFSLSSIQRFYRVSGREPPTRMSKQLIKELTASQAWAAWRRAQVTLIVFEIREMLKQIAPQMELSAAVFADQDRARNGVMQDWATWVNYQLIDTLIPMNYTTKHQLFSRLSSNAAKVAPRERLLMGIGAWLLTRNPTEMVRQGTTALSTGSGGVVLFSYSNLFSRNGRNAVSQFEANLFATP